jgi:hypothetical protein
MADLIPAPEEHLYESVAAILDEARGRVARTVNTAIVHAYWMIGSEIVEVEQQGKERGLRRRAHEAPGRQVDQAVREGLQRAESSQHAAVLPDVLGWLRGTGGPRRPAEALGAAQRFRRSCDSLGSA